MFDKGFSLIEILVAITIIVIISVIGYASLTTVKTNANDAKKKADVNSIVKAYETTYDPASNNGQGGYTTDLNPSTQANQNLFASKSFPKPPEGGDYTILQNPVTKGFTVCAALGTNTTCDHASANTCYCVSSVQAPPPPTPAPVGAPVVNNITYVTNPTPTPSPSPSTVASTSPSSVPTASASPSYDSALACVYATKWGSSIMSGGSFYSPYNVAVDNSSNVYVSDSGQSRVYKYDSSGNLVTSWGDTAGAGGVLSGIFGGTIWGIAADTSNNIYVVDAGCSVCNSAAPPLIHKFNSSGSQILQWGSAGSGNGQFNYPFGIAIDKDNYIYVVDVDNNRIQKFDSSGNYQTQWGSAGSGNGQFNNPRDISVDSQKNVYVTEESNNRIQKFDSTGHYLTQWGPLGMAAGVAIDKHDNVIVGFGSQFNIKRFNPSGTLLSDFGSYTGFGGFGSGNGQFFGLSDVAVDKSNNSLYSVEAGGNSRIQKFTCPDSGTNPSPRPIPTPAPPPYTITVNVFVDNGAGGGTADNNTQDGLEDYYRGDGGTITIIDLSNGNTFASSNSVRTNYRFSNIPAGHFRVTVTPPAGYRMGTHVYNPWDLVFPIGTQSGMTLYFGIVPN